MKTIKQEIILNASPHELYEAILNPKIHAKLTGSKATNTMKAGGAFSAYDNYITGTNLELVKDKKIVQKWTSTDFPEGHYSEVTFKFVKKGDKTRLLFTQKGVPDENYDEISGGWYDFYWKPLKEMFK